jgi:hypothetical protein
MLAVDNNKSLVWSCRLVVEVLKVVRGSSSLTVNSFQRIESRRCSALQRSRNGGQSKQDKFYYRVWRHYVGIM